MEIDQGKIEQAIVADAVHSIIADDELYVRIQRGINERLDKVFADTVSQQISNATENCFKQGFEREYIKRDGFGKPIGKPTSISKELERIISGYWEQRVDRNGKPANSSNVSATTRAEWMMAQLCADDFSKAMKQHVVNVAGSLKDHFREVLNQHVASLLSDVFKVQSAGDRARNNSGQG